MTTTRAGLALAAVVALAVLPSVPAGLHTWDNQVKLQVAWNLSRGLGPTLTEPTPLEEFYVAPGNDGRRYANYSVLAFAPQLVNLALANLGVPPADGYPFVLVLGALALALFAWGRAEGVSPPAAAFAAVLACLGTALWPSAALGYDAVLEALALTVVLWATARAGAAGEFALAGLGVGLAFAVRTGAGTLFLPSLVALAVSGPRTPRAFAVRALAFALGAAPGVVAVLAFNAWRFGDALTFYRSGGLWGDVATWTVPWFSAAHLWGLAGLWVSPGKGFIWFSPPVLGAVLLARPLARRWPQAAWVLGAYLVGASLLLARLWFWHADWCWGPRYLIPACLLAAPLGWALWKHVEARPARAALLLAALALLQVVPVVGEPLRAQFDLVVKPLQAQGLLASSNIHAPPVAADTGVLYFQPAHSMLVSVPRWLGQQLADPSTRAGVLWRGLWALAAPLAAALVGLRLARRGAGS